jgi:energy-coupling factor transport system substrate-specific component
VVLAVASAIGLGCFLYPFFLAPAQQVGDGNQAHIRLAPLLFAGVSAVCLVAMMVTLAEERPVSRSRSVALLGVLVAIDATLRLVPSLLGASTIFLLIMLVGAVFGASMGFQMGVLTLLFSAMITGGLGPWLPFQMLAAGWVGMSAGWLPRGYSMRWRLAMLAVFAAVWGLLFGVLMNLWFWPFTAPGVEADAGLYWSPGLGVAETVRRYATFYTVTSLGFDVTRAIGNVVLVLVFGGPVLRLLERYRSRFVWEPWVEHEPVAPEVRGRVGVSG